MKHIARAALMNLEPNLPYPNLKDYQQKYGLTEFVVLDSNENPFGTSPLAAQAIKDAAICCNRYPDNTSAPLRQKIAARFNINDNMVLCGNGADNILLMLGSAFLNPGDEVLVSSPYFFVYHSITALNNGIIKEVPLNDDYSYNLPELKRHITPQTKLVMTCNPNNPTGGIATEDEVQAFMADLPDHCIVVFDEAYGEFAEAERKDYAKTIPYIQANRNVLIIRTLSKTYGLAGARIGYIMGPHRLIEIMMRVQEPYTVNILAQAAAEAALDDREFLQHTLTNTYQGKQYLYRELEALNVRCLPSYTNFLFVDFGRNSADIQQQLACKGYLIRVGGGWNKPTFARITIGTMEQNRGLIQALKDVLSS